MEGGRERGRGDKTVIIAKVNQIHQNIWRQIFVFGEPQAKPNTTV